MTKVKRVSLKKYFKVGKVPNQSNYEDLIDSQLTLEETDTQQVKSIISASGKIITNEIETGFAPTGITLDGNVTASGDISLAGDIVHEGDPDTKITFTDDQIDFVAGGTTFLQLDEQGSNDIVRVNPSGEDIDFIIHADGSNNKIVMLGSNGFVGINQAIPTAQLHVVGTVVIESLPTSDPGVANQTFTQTAEQLGGSGTTKVMCVSAG